MDGRKKENRKNEGWKENRMTKKTKAENIRRQEEISKGKNKRKSMFGFCSFHLQFCNPRSF